MQSIRVGVVGFGLAGRIFHAAVVDAVEGLELAAIVQRSGTTAAAAYPSVKIARSVEELLEDTSIRLVVVATPNNTHFPIARQAMLADRDVVIDKPFTVTSSEAADLIQLARSRNRILSVYQNRRWDGDYLTVRKLLDQGVLGRLVQFEAHIDRFRPQTNLNAWRERGDPGGGVLVDLGSHLIDQAVMAFGLPESLWADVRAEREGGRVNDAFDVRLRYPAPSESLPGLTVWLRSTAIARDPGPRFTLNGAQATYRKFGFDPQEDTLLSGDLFKTKPWGVEPPERWGTLTSNEAGQPVSRRVPTEAGDFRHYYANVRDAILGRGPLAVTPIQAWRTMRLLEMAAESNRRGCEIACDLGPEP